MKLIWAFGLAQVVSFLFGTQFGLSFKACLGYAFEVVLLYVLVSGYLQSGADVIKLLLAICYGLAALAIVATIEKYSAWHLTAMIGGLNDAGVEEGDINSTYPHRIQLGYGLAMGLPLALALCIRLREARGRRILWGIVLLLIGADYFAMSRGPWLATGLCMGAVAVIGGAALRRKLKYIVLLAAIVLIVRPGVWDTLFRLAHDTFDKDSLKGGSYDYRWDLWRVAWKEIDKSPVRLLFGYGPNSTMRMDLSEYWRGQEGWTSSVQKLGYTSWDNQYACDWIELGFVGLGLELALFLSIVRLLYKNWREADPADRLLQGGIAASCAILMFAMTNVAIFAPQLKYLFWTLVAVGSNFTSIMETSRLNQEAIAGFENDGKADQAEASELRPYPSF